MVIVPSHQSILINWCHLIYYYASLVALCPSHQQRHISSLQAATLQHELGHSRRGFGCFLLPTRLFRFKGNTSRASYKSSEESQGAGAVDPLPYAEAILVQGNASWWQLQFPRRWVIVLLCFASFLLCNMDRVSLHKFEPMYSDLLNTNEIDALWAG